jgi:hypothetical protein
MLNLHVSSVPRPQWRQSMQRRVREREDGEGARRRREGGGARGEREEGRGGGECDESKWMEHQSMQRRVREREEGEEEARRREGEATRRGAQAQAQAKTTREVEPPSRGGNEARERDETTA